MNSKNEANNEAAEPKVIKDGETVIAIFYPKTLKSDGVMFLTPNEYPLQIGLLEHKNDKKVELHRHPDIKYDVHTTQEMLYVEKGEVIVNLTNNDWKPISDIKLTAGDFILFVSGAHAVDIKKGSRIIEVKQGPYPGEKQAKIYHDKDTRK